MSETRVISRRDLLKTAGAVGAAVATSNGCVSSPAVEVEAAQAPATRPAREAYESLTAHEADTLEAIVERLIPTDASGPGAREARAGHYIDRALAGALAGSLGAYRAGFAALDRHCQTSRGKAFIGLSASDQEAVLREVEGGAATTTSAGFTGGSSAFFNMVKAHTWQGTFGDPYYGGNANFVGWDLLGYPGVRTMVSAADQQRLEKNQLSPNHRSAYDFDGFNKATAHAGEPPAAAHDETHADASDTRRTGGSPNNGD